MNQIPTHHTAEREHTYAHVILPVKFRGEITYQVPDIYAVQLGSRVKVDFAGKIYSGVVRNTFSYSKLQQELLTQAALRAESAKNIIYKPIQEIEELPLISKEEILFWEQIARYYLCSIGEVFKAAYPGRTLKQEVVKPRKSVEQFFNTLAPLENITPPTLSNAQQQVYETISATIYPPTKPVLLKGITGSGKTEIYINLVKDTLSRGENVLYMVPEIALSKQLYIRLKKVFGERLLIFHSKQTIAEKGKIQKILTYRHANIEHTNIPNPSVIILGTRSALLLPYNNLGLIILDEEHDSSYKQSEPSPRYHSRDTAIMLANIHQAAVVMGTATPSFESEYNASIGRFLKVELNEKYHGAQEPQVEIIDTISAYKTRQMQGNFSQKLINEIRKTLSQQGQVLIFRNRRSYSPVVECTECGTIPKCPHCNVYLSYHKYNHTLRCHYCDHIAGFSGICPTCGLDTVRYKGAGTEKLEEELKTIFPQTTIARYDADIAKSKQQEEQVLRDFTSGEIQILIGTQMISKGFDFSNLNLVAIIQAETILGIQDFRADEKALQLLSQLMGRTGRRAVRGKFLIQSTQKEHPVFIRIKELSDTQTPLLSETSPLSSLLEERKEFRFAPYVRMVKIILKHRNPDKLDLLCDKLSTAEFPCLELTGPFVPTIDKIRGEHIKCFYVKYARDGRLAANKETLLKAIEKISGHQSIIIDVDPL